MPRRRGARRRQREAADDGNCVWTALAAGLDGVAGVPRAHERLPGHIRALVRSVRGAAAVATVTWNDEPLSTAGVEETLAALGETRMNTRDGTPVGACDPLLTGYAAAFRVDVEHVMCGRTFCYRVPGARRTVHLSSSQGHMWHERNEEHVEGY